MVVDTREEDGINSAKCTWYLSTRPAFLPLAAVTDGKSPLIQGTLLGYGRYHCVAGGNGIRGSEVMQNS